MALARVVDVGIDPPVEDLVEARIERRSPKEAPAHVVPGEGRKMPEVEDKRMAEGDRPFQHRVRGDDGEETIGPVPHGPEPLGQIELDSRSHGVSIQMRCGVASPKPSGTRQIVML